MLKFFELIKSQWRLLFRDKVAILILFIMPMCFVFVITALQTKNPHTPQHIPVAVVTFDKGQFTQTIRHGLSKNPNLALKMVKQPTPLIVSQLKSLVARGHFQALIVIPKGTSQIVAKQTKQSLIGQKINTQNSPVINVIFDPAAPSALKQSVLSNLKALMQQVQMHAMGDVVSEIIGSPTAKSPQLARVQVTYAGVKTTPNPVQQNIPAWALFGMFFIVIPLSSIIIKERDQGITARLRVAPVSRFLLLMRRVIAFMAISLLQLILMLLVGVFIMPLIGLPQLNLFPHIGLVLIIGLASALAATSFGLLIGTYSRTTEQASALGPILIVIAAAIGGIMVPMYLMPAGLQAFSQFSPLYWAQHAFIDVFVRNTGFSVIYPNLLKLILFSFAAIGLSWLKHSR